MARVAALTWTLSLVVSSWLPARPLPAQDVDRDYCEDTPANNCPGEDCRCVDDRIGVVFPLVGIIRTPVFRYREFQDGIRIDAEIVVDVESEPLQAFSYGVRHDPAVLELIPGSIRTDDTLLDNVVDNGLVQIVPVDGGFLHAVVLSLVNPDTALPTGRHVVARASYRLIADAGLEGSRIRVVDDLAQPAAEPLDIVITVAGRSRQPRVLSDGIVRRVDIPPEDCENGVDDDGDRLVDGDDPECQECVCEPPVGDCFEDAFYFGGSTGVETVDAVGQAGFTISTRNSLPLLGFQLGAARVDNASTFTYRFSSQLGTDPERLVELLMTDVNGDSRTPAIGNQVTTGRVAITGISHGAATRDLAPGDFLAFDLEPGVGGPGFFVGYVTDLDGDENRIPATGEGFGGDCPLNEVLTVELEAPAGECPPFAIYFGREGTDVDHDARGDTTFSISSTNARALLGFQLGVRTIDHADGVRYAFSSELGTDPERLVEILMTDELGDSITPATPNRALSSSAQVLGVGRGAATRDFSPGDFLAVDLEPGVGGPGFFVGYVSDLDGNENVIPSTQAGGCFLNELLVVEVEPGDTDCHDNALYFGSAPRAGRIDATGEASFAISSRSSDPLLGVQFGVAVRPADGGFTFELSGELGTDADRLVEILFTNDVGDSIAPATPNTLLASSGVVLDLARGAAITDFEGGDFLAVDLEPGVGGPGFFVGYVSDLDGDENKIPATAGDGCPLNELLVVSLDVEPTDCAPADFAVFFGPQPTTATLDARGADQVVLSSRNAQQLLGFQLGVAIEAGADGSTFRFTDSLGTDAERLVEVLMTDSVGDSVDPLELNRMITDASAVSNISRGAALAGFEDGDFLAFDLDPGTGAGFFVGYVSDLDDDANRIPATSAGDDCDANELLVVELVRDVRFFRGDADGNDRVNVSDAVLILMSLVGALPRRFECEDVLDADDDGQLLMTDGIHLLNWKFNAGPALPAPFFSCSIDPTDDGLAACAQSNCQ